MRFTQHLSRPLLTDGGIDMLAYFFGMIVGGVIGIVFMCLLQINRTERRDDDL